MLVRILLKKKCYVRAERKTPSLSIPFFLLLLLHLLFLHLQTEYSICNSNNQKCFFFYSASPPFSRSAQPAKVLKEVDQIRNWQREQPLKPYYKSWVTRGPHYSRPNQHSKLPIPTDRRPQVLHHRPCQRLQSLQLMEKSRPLPANQQKSRKRYVDLLSTII